MCVIVAKGITPPIGLKQLASNPRADIAHLSLIVDNSTG